MAEQTERVENVHISYENKPFEMYHDVVAKLALKHTPPSGRIIDIGCGVGTVLGLIRQGSASLQLMGVDAFPECTERTQRAVPNVQTHIVNMNDLDLSEAGTGFDTAIMCHTLEHFERPLDVIRTVSRILKPGGILILAVPNPATPIYFASSVLRRHYVNKGHVYSWDRAHWINFVERIAGLDVVEYAVDELRLAPPRMTHKSALLRKLQGEGAKLFPGLSFSNIAVTRRPSAS